jgi:NTE family protein
MGVNTKKMATKKKSLGFALGAGGSRGVAHIGFLQAMEEAGIKPDFITGCSMGSVVGAAYASGMSPAEMHDAVFKLKPLDIIDVTAKMGGLFNTGKMRKVLEKYIGDIEFSQLKIPFRCVAVDMYTQSVVTFSEGKVVDGVVASSSIPAIFRPTEKDGMRLVDGGILERVPVRQLKDMGAKKIVAIDVLGQRECNGKHPSALGTLLEILDLTDNARTRIRREENKKIIDLWLEPDIGNMSQYSFKTFPRAYEQGYKLGVENADAIRRLLEE